MPIVRWDGGVMDGVEERASQYRSVSRWVRTEMFWPMVIGFFMQEEGRKGARKEMGGRLRCGVCVEN